MQEIEWKFYGEKCLKASTSDRTMVSMVGNPGKRALESQEAADQATPPLWAVSPPPKPTLLGAWKPMRQRQQARQARQSAWWPAGLE